MQTQLHTAENAWNPYANVPLLVQGLDPRTRKQKTFVNRGKMAQKFCEFTTDTYPVTIPANGRVRDSIFAQADQGGSGDVEFYQWWARSTGQYAIMLTNLAMGSIKLMNQPVESSLIFGNGPQVAAKLLQPVFVAATDALDCEFVDLSGNSNTVYLTAHGCQIVDPMNTLGVTQQQVRAAMYNPNVVPYWLTFDQGSQVTVGANATTEYTMSIPSNADFNSWCIVGRATAPTSLQVELFEGSRRRLSNGPIFFDQCMSTTGQTASLNAASLPFMWNFSHTFERKTQIVVRLTDTSGSQQTVSSCIWGQLVYYDMSPPSFVPVSNLRGVQQAAAPAYTQNLQGLRGYYGRGNGRR